MKLFTFCLSYLLAISCVAMPRKVYCEGDINILYAGAGLFFHDKTLTFEDFKSSSVGKNIKKLYTDLNGVKPSGAKFDEIIAMFYLDSKNLAENEHLKMEIAILESEKYHKSYDVGKEKYLDDYKSQIQTKIAQCIASKK